MYMDSRQEARSIIHDEIIMMNIGSIEVIVVVSMKVKHIRYKEYDPGRYNESSE